LNGLLLGVIGLLWAANVAVITVAVFQTRDRRADAVGARAHAPAGVHAGTTDGLVRPDAAPQTVTRSDDRAELVLGDRFAGTAAAIEAFVAGVDGMAGGAPRSTVGALGTSSTDGAPGPGSAIAGRLPARSLEPTPALAEPAAVPADDRDEPSAITAWDRIVRDESTRMARFRRPATVVFGEVPDLDILAERLGPLAADRVAQQAARLVEAEGRASDRLAWLGPSSFAVLLVETRELDAGPYVERIRAAADGWFASAGLSIHLRVGWAGPDDDQDLVSAATIARERMQASRTTTTVPPVHVRPSRPAQRGRPPARR
jgi:GGDEF domain-containing protein